MPQLLIEQLTKEFIVGDGRITAVANASLSVEQGDFVSIVGHSGSGKTTLLSMIGGMARPTTGRIQFNGADIYTLDSDGLSTYRCEQVGFMFQSASLLPVLTSKENLMLPRAFRSDNSSISRAEQERKALELLEAVGLSDKIDAYPAQLSGGQQRRVAIARAFMNDPALILADEPTGDLDEETESDMMRFFQRMNKDRRVTFLMVTHNSELARQAGTRLKMDHGVISTL